MAYRLLAIPNTSRLLLTVVLRIQSTFSTERYTSGSSKGEPRIPTRRKPNSICLPTECTEEKHEEERRIIGMFADMVWPLQDFLTITVRIGMALLFGGALGAERGLRNRPAGFMTYVLVCIGSTTIMLTNQYISVNFPQIDPTRFGAQVVSGIGFLGAGTIIVTQNDEVRGLTTAAGLWLAAGLGLAIGAGFYAGAVVTFLFSIFSLIILRQVDIYIKQHAKSMEIYLEYNSRLSF